MNEIDGTAMVGGRAASRPALLRLRATLVVIAASGVVLQSIRTEDPAFFLLYFTIWSAILSAAAAFAHLMGSQWQMVGWVRDASCVGALLSCVVYLAVLLPASGFSSDDGTVTWAANLLLHVITPALAVIEFLLAPRVSEPTWRGGAAWILFPMTYLVTVLVLAGKRDVKLAYDFLDVSSFGAPAVVASCLAATALYLLLAASVICWRRHRWNSIRSNVE